MSANVRTARTTALSLSLSLLGVLIVNPVGYSQVATMPAGSAVAPVDAIPSAVPDGSGNLMAMVGGKQLGKCPLKHTDVKAQVSGYVARVSVKQKFRNTFNEKIEAVYTFPLPENAAVDEMTMKVGTRVIRGSIKKREEARNIYETARAQGYVASLLDQERPNIFTQSVANIEPGEEVEIEIKYVDLLAYEAGNFTFSFPTVVGPRFNPGSPVGKQGLGRAPDTDVVPDASKITPQVAAEGTRAGHDISISLDIAAGIPIGEIQSKLHEVSITRGGKVAGREDTAHVELASKATIPNKDFVVTWAVAKDELQSGYLTHHDKNSGYFTLMLLPPKRVTPKTIAPKEMIFLIDCSGSQRGRPLEKAKETMDYIVDHMNPNDSFQIIAFNHTLNELSTTPLKNSPETRERAKQFIETLQANGGTWMGPAVQRVLALPPDENRLRVVVFMTDGYVGNDFEIRSLVRKHRDNSRWFPFGTGNSVNRFLIDGMAKDGGGEAEYVLLNSSGPEVGAKFYKRISSPVLTNVKLAFNGVSVKEVYPVETNDVWAERPLYFKGRYTAPGAGTVTLTGFSGGKPYKQDLKIVFPEKQDSNEVIKSVWARAKVDRLMAEDFAGAQTGSVNAELKEEIIKTALDHHIMTQYTSFVAVEETKVTEGGKAKAVAVEVELPDGVSREATIGDSGGAKKVRTRRGEGARFDFSPNTWRSQAAGYPAPVLAGGAGAPSGAQPMQSYSPYTGSVPVQGRLMARAGAAMGTGIGAVTANSLPQTNMGMHVHQPGDNQYAAGKDLARHGIAPGTSGGGGAAAGPSAQRFPLSAPASKSAASFKERESRGNSDGDAAGFSYYARQKSESKSKPREESSQASSWVAKLDSKLQSLVAGSSAKSTTNKLKVSLLLAELSPAVRKQLTVAGLNISSEDGKRITGTISLANLRKLCELAVVLQVESATALNR